MICEKVFTCSTEKLEEVVLALAEDIKAGYRIGSVELLDFTMKACIRPEPCAKIQLINRRTEE